MDIDDLRAFVEVADAGGVTLAAERLGISKSMVSRRLVRLEAELSTQLIARSTRGASLTEAGATFRDYAARVVAEVDATKETILPEGELSGRLRIAAPLSFGPTHFAHVLAELAKRHPRLHVHASYTDRFVDLIAEGFDCAIRVGKLTDSKLVATKIGPLHSKYVAAPEYIAVHGSPDTPEELVKHEALMQGTETWPAQVGDQVIAMKPQGRFKADNGVALVAAALAGIGVAVLPVDLIQEHLESGALAEIMPLHPVPVYGIYVVRPQGHPSRKIRVLIELLIECFGQTTLDAEGERSRSY